MFVMEEKKPIPLVYDRTRTGKLACAKELGNVAIAAIPESRKGEGDFHAGEGGFLASVKASSRPRSRLALHCAIGTLNATTVLQAFELQPTLAFDLSSTPPARKQVQGPTLALQSMEISRSGNVRQDFHSMVNTAGLNHVLFANVSDKAFWMHQLQCLDGWLGRDSRLFFLWHNGRSIPCLLGYRKRRKGGSILVLGTFSMRFENVRYNAPHSYASELDILDSVHQLRKSERLKNLMPLIAQDGHLWNDQSNVVFWFMDAMGGPNNRPSLLHWSGSLERTSPYIERSNPDFLLKDCQQFTGWRGNGPLVQFTEKLWLGIVHRWHPVPKSDADALGRNYSNIPALFEADRANGLPTRCYGTGIIAEGHYVMEADPATGWNMPFAFIMGLVHLGRVRDHHEGTVHRFLLSAGLNDFVPVLSRIDVFIPG
uniref:Uncharacterized protein n=1 Tax=Picocystis salinarum TaxID=88271 RepID=A0A6U9QFP9_9CHLO